jgi:hypothetical protein
MKLTVDGKATEIFGFKEIVEENYFPFIKQANDELKLTSSESFFENSRNAFKTGKHETARIIDLSLRHCLKDLFQVFHINRNDVEIALCLSRLGFTDTEAIKNVVDLIKTLTRISIGTESENFIEANRVINFIDIDELFDIQQSSR